jgi:hypothetical protein
MQFLNPIFLLGLLATAIPILLHFLSRRRLDEIPFAPLRFLLPTQERQMRRLNLRRLLLLLLRIAIVTAVVMAMARPTLTGGLASLVRTCEGASVVLLVDASASMRAETTTGTLFDAARREVAQIAAGLNREDEAAVMLFDQSAKALFSEFVRDPGLVLAELDEAEASYHGTDYLNAIESAMDLLQRGSRNHREIYLVSDFQAVEQDTLRLARFRERLKSELPTNIYLRPVSGEPFVNRQVVRVDRPPTLLRSGQTAEVGVVVRQDGDSELPVQLFLQIDGTTVGETELRLGVGSTQRHVFPLTLPDTGDLAGSSRLRPDRLPVDDERFFVLSVGAQVPAMVITGIEGLVGERDPMLFLEAALDPTGRGDGNFALTRSLASELDPDQLVKSHVVIGVDVRGLGAARLAALGDYLESGGTMLLFVGDPRVRSYTNEKLLPQWTELRLGSFRGEEETHERLEISARDHPALAGFEPEELETLKEVQLRNFYRLPETLGRPLLSFQDGGAAVVELEVGHGRIILCGFHTAATAGDLPYSPMFLPLIQRLAGYLATAGWGRFGRHFELGESVALAAPDGSSATDQFDVVDPRGGRHSARLDASVAPARVQFEAAEVPGIYSFERDGERWALAALNVPESESNPLRLTAQAFRDGLGESGNARFRALEGESARDALRGARQGLAIHRWFLTLAGLLLIAEGLMSRRVSGSIA